MREGFDDVCITVGKMFCADTIIMKKKQYKVDMRVLMENRVGRLSFTCWRRGGGSGTSVNFYL